MRAELAHGINTSNTATVPRPAPGRWKDGICDWPQNLSPSCYCVCCFSHGMWLLAQSKPKLSLLCSSSSTVTVYLSYDLVSQRTGFATFNAVIYMTIIVWVVAFILNFFYAYAFYWFPIICFYVFALLLRMHFVRHQNINDNPMGLFGEFCCGFWCWYCSVSQSKPAADLCIGHIHI